MLEGLKIDKNIGFDLVFIPEEIRKEFEKHDNSSPHSDSRWSKDKNKISVKTKIIWIVVGLLFFYTFYNKYSNYLIDKERKEILEKEEKERVEKEALFAEIEKQKSDAERNINNAKIAINNAKDKKVEKNEASSVLLKQGESSLDKAYEALKNKEYSQAIAKAKDALEKANNSIILFEEKKEDKRKEKEKYTAKQEKKKTDKSKKTSQEKTAEKDIEETSKDEEVSKKAEEKEKKQSEEEINKLKNKAVELLTKIKEELKDENALILVEKHFSEKLNNIKGKIINIEADIDNNKFIESIEISDKLIKEIIEIKKSAEKEDVVSEEKRKEALEKILEVQKALKQRRLEKGK